MIPGIQNNLASRLVLFAFFVVGGTTTQLANAAFHFWNIREIYTNSGGDLQFIELFDVSGGQQFVTGQQIQVTNLANTQTHMFTLTYEPVDDSFNRALLLATSKVDAAGGPTPDYVLPDSFLFPEGGTINFFGANSGSYSALPTNGSLSRVWGTSSNAVNSPQNFAGDVGQVMVVPEPHAAALLASGSACLLFLSLRRRTQVRGLRNHDSAANAG